MNFLFKYLLTIFLCMVLWQKSGAQCPSFEIVGKRMSEINSDASLTEPGKLTALYHLKTNVEQCRLLNDTTYAMLLRSIAYYENIVNKNNQLAIRLTLDAIRINNTLKSRGSGRLPVVGYYSVGYFSQNAKLYRQALAYYDSAVACSKTPADINTFRMPSRRNKAYISFFLGDYEKSVEECILGMNDAVITKDSAQYLIFLNIKAQSLCFANSLNEAASEARLAVQMAKRLNDSFELAAAFKTSGFIAERKNEFDSAKDFFLKSIAVRKRTGDIPAIAGDYNDLGNFFLSSEHNYTEAKRNYLSCISYALQVNSNSQRSSQLALAYANLGDNSFANNKLTEASQYYTRAFRYLNIELPDYLFTNPSETQLSIVEHKELVYSLLTQKTTLLLQLYAAQKNVRYLRACLQTALLTDSVITHTRHELTAESSKLFWRNNTRLFFNNAMEACYLSGNAKLAFYFMEKSRAVLLNDRLNEIGASSALPLTEVAKEENLQTKIIETEQELVTLSPASKEYTFTYNNLLQTREELEHFIRSLEKKYPAYYQYKYADNVPALDTLQQHLAKSKQSFVHYFMNDTVMYVLGIAQNNTKFIKLSKKDFDTNQLAAFLQLCSDKEKLKSKYVLFASLAQNIYTQLFKPLQLPKGDVAICTDNFLIPFEALCTDKEGKNFLLKDYSFSYVYSARTFMNPLVGNTAANGNFAGFAPVAFAPALQLVSLNQSAEALFQSADFYNKHILFTNNKATRTNFFNNASKYRVIAVFSHAQADTSGTEPVLYLQDSAIQLSELQLLQKPAAQLVLLSACQTNIGKTATGEGIYSLARGFAAAGIPAVAGTLWKADDQTIYRISSKFNEYLAAGMRKSEALQKAKRWFLNQYKDERQLPYYWANMILIGNTQPVSLIKENYFWWIAVTVFMLIAGTAMAVWAIKNKRHSMRNNITISQPKKLVHI